jgi:aminobenzoyl-glutamate transport protein
MCTAVGQRPGGWRDSAGRALTITGDGLGRGIDQTARQKERDVSAADGTADAGQRRSFMQKMLDGIERVGNKVPHPVMLFLYLIVGVIVLSHLLYLMGVSITDEVLVPVTVPVETDYVGGSVEPIPQPEDVWQGYPDYDTKVVTTPIRSLLTVDGLRFLLTSFVHNFAGFNVVAVIFVAMIGVGVAEQAGLMAALIRKLVAIAPRAILTFIIVFIGGLSSVATDAGYLILVPLGAAAFLSVGRHPIAGVAAAYAGVSVAFAVNILIAPLDAMLTEMTNEAIRIVDPNRSITITANFFFNTVFTLIMAIAVTLITERMIEPRLGAYHPEPADTADGAAAPAEAAVDPAAEGRGLRFALYGFLAGLALVLLVTLPPGAPLRDPQTGNIIGNTPFMDSLIFVITMLFLLAGIGYGLGAGTIKSSNDAIAGVTKTFAGLSGLIFMLLIISQFIAYFNWTNMPQVIAGAMAGALERAGLGAVPLLVGMVVVVMLLDIIIPGAMPKWAIFAPIFVPVFMRLGVEPQTVLAAYRIGDSPMNVVTPLMVYLPFIVLVSQRYRKDVGLGTIISLMLPYTVVVAVIWIVLFVIWFVLGIPLGPGYPPRV